MWDSLRVRNYRLFAAGQVVSLMGTWMQRVAQDWLVVTITHNSGVAIGVTTGLQFAPTLLLSLYGGVLADRFPKRRILLITQAAMMACALVLGSLVLSGGIRLWMVYVLATALGLASSVDTPTRQAFVTELVGPGLVTNAVSLNSATFNTARIAGTAAAGFLIALTGTGVVFLLNAASFLAVIYGLLLMRDRELFAPARRPRAPGELRAALRYVRGRPEILLPIILTAVVGTMGLNFQLTTALVARVVYHRDAASYGLLSTALAAGSLLGALLAARRHRPRMALLVAAALAFGLLEVGDGLMPSYWTLMALLVPTGIAVLTFSTAANSTVQLAADPQMRGRVMALYVLVFLGGTPFGAPLIGWLSGTLGPRYGFIVGGVSVLLTALAVGGYLLRRRLATPPVRPPGVVLEPAGSVC